MTPSGFGHLPRFAGEENDFLLSSPVFGGGAQRAEGVKHRTSG